jgi:hypothetical protein|uniref:Uncharacterized protein n=1 Tax=Populus trichocarpa TaxID=3694 RepID=A0A2K2A207_POPTR
MHCFLPFEIYRPYAVYSNASCLLCSLFHGQWILGGPPLLLGLVVFIYKQQRAGPYLLFRMLASMSPFPFSTTTFLSSFKRSYHSGTQITNVGASITPYLLLLY